jgi:hypothetical protein
MHALERSLRTLAAAQRKPSTLFALLLRQAVVKKTSQISVFFALWRIG